MPWKIRLKAALHVLRGRPLTVGMTIQHKGGLRFDGSRILVANNHFVDAGDHGIAVGSE